MAAYVLSVAQLLIFLLLFGLFWNASAEYLPNGCPEDFSVHHLLPHETDCDKFYSCSNGQRILMNCSSGTLFDFELQVCNWAHDVNCEQSTTNKPTSTVPESTTSKFETTSVESETTSSESDTSSAESEVASSESETTSSESGLESDFLPNGCPRDSHVNLLLPHETACDKFYMCTHGNKVLFECPSSLFFDFELQICNWAYDVYCDLSATTTEVPETSTETLVTTTKYTTSTEQSTPEHSFSTTDGNVVDITTETSSDEYITSTTTEESISAETTTEEIVTAHTDPDLAQTTESIESTTGKTEPENVTTDHPTPPATYSTTEKTVLTTTETITITTDFATDSTQELSTIKEVTEVDSICPDGYFGHVAHPDRCDAYYLCSGWNPIPLFCLRGLEFDPVTGTCVPLTEGGCTWHATTTSTTENWAASTTVMPSVVTEGETTLDFELTTQDATTIDINTEEEGTSVPVTIITELPNTSSTGWTDESTLDFTTIYSTTEKHIETSTSIVTTPTPSSQSTVNLPETDTEPESSTNDWETTDSEIQEYTETTIAGTSEVYETTTNSEGMTPAICPDGFFGSVAHPDRCDAYYLCTGWITIPINCSPGFEFDQLVGECVGIAEGGCTWHATTTSTTNDLAASTTDMPSEVTEVETTLDYELTTQDVTTIDINTEDTEGTSVPVTIITELPNTSSTGWTDESTLELTTRYSTTEKNIESSTSIVTTPLPNTHSTVNLPETDTEPGSSTNDWQTTDSETQEYTETTTPGSTSDVYETTTNSEGAAPGICPDGFFGSLAHPDRCDAYYLCTGWITIPINCSPGFEFDQLVGECVGIAEGGCTWQQTSPTTDNLYTVTEEIIISTSPLPATNNESEELENVVTDLPKVTTESTEISSSYPTTEIEQTESEVTSSTLTSDVPEMTTEIIITTTDVDKEFTDDLTTLEYITTDQTTLLPETTITDTSDIHTTYESTTTTGQVPEIDVEVTTEATETTPALCPDGFLGHVSDPNRCDAYYFCSGWAPIPLFCSAGLEFNFEAQTCVPIAEGGCTQGQFTSSTTENNQEKINENETIEDIVTATLPEIVTTEATSEVTDSETTDDRYTLQPILTFEPNIIYPTIEPITDDTLETTIAPHTSTMTTLALTTEVGQESAEFTELTTTEAVPTEPTSICPDGFIGMMANPDDCAAYFLCSGWMPIPLRCPQGQEFDPNTEVCVETSEYGCSAMKEIRRTQTTKYLMGSWFNNLRILF